MSKNVKPHGSVVYPGEKLAVVEEFFKGPGSYRENGVVRSAEFGTAEYDLAKREVKVSKVTRELLLPKEGMDVHCEVGSVQRRNAMVDIFALDGRRVLVTYTGFIEALDGGRNLMMDVRSGDIAKAKITNTKNRVLQLSIEGSDYGVVYAYCSRCGAVLEGRRNQLGCPRCGRVERRKLARTYGVEDLK